MIKCPKSWESMRMSYKSRDNMAKVCWMMFVQPNVGSYILQNCFSFLIAFFLHL